MLFVTLTHSCLSAVGVSTEAKHQLHHLVEGAVAYDSSGAPNLGHTLLRGRDVPLGRGYLRYIHTEDRRVVCLIFHLFHLKILN